MRIKRPIYTKVHWDEFIKLAGNYCSLSTIYKTALLSFILFQTLCQFTWTKLICGTSNPQTKQISYFRSYFFVRSRTLTNAALVLQLYF